MNSFFVKWRFLRLGFPLLTIGIVAILGTIFAGIADPDLYWHIRTGEWIWLNRSLPTTDPFLLTQSTTPWSLHEWLFQLILLVAYQGGMVGVASLCGMLFALLFWVIRQSVKEYLPMALTSLFPFLVVASLMAFCLPRPQLVSYVFFAIYLQAMLAFVHHGKTKLLWYLPLIMIVWVNAHGGFFIGLAILLIAWLAHLLDQYFDGKPLQAAAPLGWSLLACILTACINPYHVKHFLFPFQTMGIWILPMISEWQAPSWKNPMFFGFHAFLVLFIFFLIYRQGKIRIFDWAVPLAVCFLGLQASRHVPFACIAIPLFIASQWHVRPNFLHASKIWAALPAGLRNKWETSSFDRNKLPSKLNQDIGSSEYPLNWAILVLAFVTAAIMLPKQQVKQLTALDANLSRDAINWIAEHDIPGPTFNDYTGGGYFIYRLWPTQKAFIDGRSDMYSDQFAKDFFAMRNGEPSWAKKFDSLAFNAVVLPPTAPLVQLLLLRGDFIQIYANKSSVVLIRKTLWPLKSTK